MTRFRDYHPNIKVRIIQIFFTDIVSGAIFPFMAIYFAEHFGAKLTGILLLINVLIGLLVGLYGGYYSDRMGRKKLMVVAGIIRMFAFIIMAVANSPALVSPEITYLMTLIIMASFGLDGPAADAMIIDITKPDQRKGVYSLLYWSFNLAFAIGGIIGALMFNYYLFELLIILSVTGLLSNILVIFFIEETMESQVHTKQKQVLRNIAKSYKEVAFDKVFLYFVLAGLFIQSIENQMENYIGVRLNEEMPEQSLLFIDVTGVEMVGFLKSENTIIVVLLTVFITKWVTKLKEDRAFLGSIIIFTAGYAGISYFNNIWLLFIFMIIATVGELMRVPIQSDYMASIPSDEKRSSYMAVYGMVFNGSMMLSSVFVSLGAIFNKEVMSILILACGFLGMMMIRKILPDLKHRRELAKQN
ncbi:MFS transporter, DHA1 family, multidrug resistance protein B [Salinibacillus kushneri]|uniref:MFS transporter, DHA1 family, multidrug resistance protein B n=1 Tax=Salinibacillus kushneri TaxID=237682 RepID=A0A1I0AT66_9BACI|nr:MFS transporter [Salinibacillus kushneri]SES97565.1 MFS transporter, DHA1 family, multidrug resistance protein B [Salinibacillus kushneri]